MLHYEGRRPPTTKRDHWCTYACISKCNRGWMWMAYWWVFNTCEYILSRLILLKCLFCRVIVQQGWKGYVPGEMSVSSTNRDRFKHLVRKIKDWLYSWMRPGYVESDEEYKISKLFLLQFLCSASVLMACDGSMHIVICMLRFVQTKVFVYEDLYLYYRRRHVRHYDVSHGTQHEVCIINHHYFVDTDNY